MQLRIDGSSILIGEVELQYDPADGQVTVFSGHEGLDIDMDLLVQSMKSVKVVADNAHKRKR